MPGGGGNDEAKRVYGGRKTVFIFLHVLWA